MKQLLKKSFSKETWSYPTNMNLTMKKITILFVVFIIGQVGIGFLISTINQTIPSVEINYMLLNVLMNLFMIIIIPIIYSHREVIRDFFNKSLVSSKTIQSGIFYGLVAIAVNILVGALLFYLYSMLGVEPKQQQVVQLVEGTKNLNPIFLYFAIAISAPIAEEIFFRGVVFRTFALKINYRNAIIMSSILFSLLHFDLYYIPQIFLISLVFSVAYNETGSILTPIIAHLISNSLFIIPFLISL
ncbi:MAG: CPBP family intramembrane glutamic endopeptidase [Clostridia bacterium]